MTDLGNIDDRIMSTAIGRIQACVDQIVGVHTSFEAGVDLTPDYGLSEHTLRVMALLQVELDKALGLTPGPCVQRLADGSAWLLEQLKS